MVMMPVFESSIVCDYLYADSKEDGYDIYSIDLITKKGVQRVLEKS